MSFKVEEDLEKVLPDDESEKEEPKLEDLFEEIEGIADELEGSDISLEESFALYDKGLRLLKQSNNIIDEIEKKVLVLDSKGETREF
jgi:exodeoxyribonuclease VII small subunit